MTNQETTRLTAAETAKLLKKQLRTAFKGTKFSVTGSRGTGYGYYSVSWTGGPSSDAVREITRPFEGSSYNGMEDIEEYNKTFLGFDAEGRPLESGMRGIALSRETTEEEIAAAMAELAREGFTRETYPGSLDSAARSMARGTECLLAARHNHLPRD